MKFFPDGDAYSEKEKENPSVYKGGRNPSAALKRRRKGNMSIFLFYKRKRKIFIQYHLTI